MSSPTYGNATSRLQTNPCDDILSRLQGVTQQGDSSHQARCPAHDDDRASLTVTSEEDGKVLLYCHAGCTTESVVASLDLEMCDLFPASTASSGGESMEYDYQDADGTLIMQVARMPNKQFRQRKPDGHGGWNWSVKGCKVVPYRLPDIHQADPSKTVYVVEGEKDADRLASLGLLATCNSGGAGKWKSDHASFLAGRNVVILPDNDAAGLSHADKVMDSLEGVAESVRIVQLPGLPAKGDVSDWLDSGGTVASLQELVEQQAPRPIIKIPRSPASQPSPASTALRELTDLGNAERFTAMHGEDVRYINGWKKWVVWSGTHWKIDEGGEIMVLAKRTAKAIHREAEHADSQKEQQAIASWARTSQSRNKLEAMIKLAESEKPIPISHDDLDQDAWIFNCENGTLDLRTGELRGHQRDDFQTKIAPVEYPTEPGVDAVEWEEFLDQIFGGNTELIRFVQRLLGYSLVGEVSEHILPIFVGGGSNGKSVLLDVVHGTVGQDYSIVASPDLLLSMKGRNHPTEKADLFRRRFVSAVESDEGRRLAEGTTKALTGGDRIRARRMGEDFWEFVPSHTIVMATNHMPDVRGTDHGIWRRLKIVPFNVTIPPKQQDKHLAQKLLKDRGAILRWMVKGCLDWQRDGLGEPEAVVSATGEYRNDQDALSGFLEECCLVGEDHQGKSSTLYSCYQDYAGQSGEAAMTRKQFSSHLIARGFQSKRSNGIVYCGITLNTGGIL